jgi:hypothetical protein
LGKGKLHSDTAVRQERWHRCFPVAEWSAAVRLRAGKESTQLTLYNLCTKLTTRRHVSKRTTITAMENQTATVGHRYAYGSPIACNQQFQQLKYEQYIYRRVIRRFQPILIFINQLFI